MHALLLTSGRKLFGRLVNPIDEFVVENNKIWVQKPKMNLQAFKF